MMLKDSNITTCEVIYKRKRPGRGLTGRVAGVLYYVENKEYRREYINSSDNYKIGDKFLIRYSIKDPGISEVLWDEKVADESWSVDQ